MSATLSFCRGFGGYVLDYYVQYPQEDSLQNQTKALPAGRVVVSPRAASTHRYNHSLLLPRRDHPFEFYYRHHQNR
jgi:hypothetical protein